MKKTHSLYSAWRICPPSMSQSLTLDRTSSAYFRRCRRYVVPPGAEIGLAPAPRSQHRTLPCWTGLKVLSSVTSKRLSTNQCAAFRPRSSLRAKLGEAWSPPLSPPDRQKVGPVISWSCGRHPEARHSHGLRALNSSNSIEMTQTHGLPASLRPTLRCPRSGLLPCCSTHGRQRTWKLTEMCTVCTSFARSSNCDNSVQLP